MDDEAIIALFFERSQQAIGELDQKYGKACRGLSRNILGSPQDAEECVNDAYLGAWNAIPPARPSPLLTYVLKIVRNVSLKSYWKREADKRSSRYTVALEEVEACLPGRDTVEGELGARELAKMIEGFLDTLSAENRVIFLRRYWFADSCRDIAGLVGLSEKAVSVRLTRTRGKMKQYLKERGICMNVKQFSDAMGELDSRYVEEAAHYRKRAGRSGWMKWGAVAACLCLMVVGGAMLAQKSGTGAPDPDFVQIPNPVLSVASAEEMEAYLDFDVPVLDKEVGGYFVLVEEGYPTMGQIDYADGSAFRMQYGSGDISGIHGGTFEKSEEIAGVRVEYYSYNEISYAIWEQNGFTFSYEYTDNGSAEVEAIIQQFK